jgi:hypothetical protein
MYRYASLKCCPAGGHFERQRRQAERRALKDLPVVKSHHDALVQFSFHDIGRKLGFLHKLLER